MLNQIFRIMIFTGVVFFTPITTEETAKIESKEVVVVNSNENYVCEWLDMEISKEEFELLCRTTFCEAGNQDFETQKMVCLTILNRIQSEKFPNTISGAVYDKNAYEVTTWSDFETKEWTEQAEYAVLSALKENNHPGDMYYFRTEHFHTFGESYLKSDDLYFSLEGE